MKALRALIWISILLPAVGLQAQSSQSIPIKGMAYSATEPSSVKYDCKKTAEDRITCDFTSLDVYKIDSYGSACTIAMHSYVQSFRRNLMPSAGLVQWITEDPPDGECKTVREASFTSDGVAWSYAARYKVGNKSARQGLLNCAEIREQEATYVPSQTEKAGWIHCESVRFAERCWSPDFPCLGRPPTIPH